MDDKPPPSRRSSGHSEKAKKKSKARKKNKRKDRKRSKVSSPEYETNSDSALSGHGRNTPDKRNGQKSNTSSRPSPSTSKSSHSVAPRKSKSNSSSTGSEPRSQNDFLEKCISDIFDKRRQESALTLESLSSSSARSRNTNSSAASLGRTSSDAKDIDADVDRVCEAVNESLRWTNRCSDPEDEQERLRVYKINRRKRYMMDIVKSRKDKEGVLKFARELASQDVR